MSTRWLTRSLADVPEGDAWLGPVPTPGAPTPTGTVGILTAIRNSPIWPNTAVILTWDEGSGLITASDDIPTIFAGAHVQRGITSSTPITHYNVLRTLEDMYGLTPLAEAANASAITDVWDDVIFAAIFE